MQMEKPTTTIAARHRIREDIIAFFPRRCWTTHSNIAGGAELVNGGRHNRWVTKYQNFPNWEGIFALSVTTQTHRVNGERICRRPVWPYTFMVFNAGLIIIGASVARWTSATLRRGAISSSTS